MSMTFTPDHIVQSLQTMYSAAPQADKKAATTYLEQFQKSSDAWEIANNYLGSSAAGDTADIQTRLFFAQTLRNKLTYDLGQVGDHNLGNIRQLILGLLSKYREKPFKLIRTQLAICLVQLILQDFAWAHPLSELCDFFVGQNMVEPLFEFLKILPEELSDIKKTSLTDDQFNARTNAIINTQNVEQIFLMLNQAVAKDAAAVDTNVILDCLNNWIKEYPIESFLKIDSLTNLVFSSIHDDRLQDKSVDCIVTIIRETRDLENFDITNALLLKLIELNDTITVDESNYEVLSRLYVESCESWHVYIAKNPDNHNLLRLVEILLKYCELDTSLDIIHYSFYFWYLLKQLLILKNFEKSREVFSPVYQRLISVILRHLTYPTDANDDDLFDGDKEQEDKFKEFRYEMGDVLKDATAVVGPIKALSIPFAQIKEVLADQSSPNFKWQYLEAALFSMRSMAKEIPKTESKILPVIMNYLIHLPEHPKIRYSATLVLGRYTEWTNRNPEYLEIQLNYIIKGFTSNSNYNEKDNNSILISSTHALMYFCQDCSKLLLNYLEQLYMLYNEVITRIDIESNFELMDGISHVLHNMKEYDPKFYETILLFLKPVLDRLDALYDTNEFDKIGQQFDILSVFFGIMKVKDYDNPDNKTVEVFTSIILPNYALKFLNKFLNNLLVNEKILKLVRSAVQSMNIFLVPNLPDLINLLLEGFKKNKFGCYLYVSGAVVREFSENDDIKREVNLMAFKFGVEQCLNFFNMLSTTTDFNSIPDVIEDFFRMINDLLMYFPNEFFEIEDDNLILGPSVESSLAVIQGIENFESIIAVTHYLIDLVSWGQDHAPISFYEIRNKQMSQFKVKRIIQHKGKELLDKLINNLIFKFYNYNNDTITIDLQDLINKIVLTNPELQTSISWLMEIFSSLPNNDVRQLNNLNELLSTAVTNKDKRRVRSGVKDFIEWYTRKNVKTRSIM